MTGSGKSTSATRCADRAFHILADRLQEDAVLRAFPFVRLDMRWRWDLWPSNRQTLRLDDLLRICLEERYRDALRECDRHILVEAAFVRNDWFREPLTRCLIELGLRFESVHHFHLHPPVPVVFQQIRQRAQENEYRRQDLNKTEQDVAEQHERWNAWDTDTEWTRFTTSRELDAELDRLLGSHRLPT